MVGGYLDLMSVGVLHGLHEVISARAIISRAKTCYDKNSPEVGHVAAAPRKKESYLRSVMANSYDKHEMT